MARWTFAVPRTLLKDGDAPLHGCYYNRHVSGRPIIGEAYTARDAEQKRMQYFGKYGTALEVRIDGEPNPPDLSLL